MPYPPVVVGWFVLTSGEQIPLRSWTLDQRSTVEDADLFEFHVIETWLEGWIRAAIPVLLRGKVGQLKIKFADGEVTTAPVAVFCQGASLPLPTWHFTNNAHELARHHLPPVLRTPPPPPVEEPLTPDTLRRLLGAPSDGACTPARFTSEGGIAN